MFFVDEEKYPVNNTKDGADSAVRVGIIATGEHNTLVMHDLYPQVSRIINYVKASGICVRHPKFNPWNFTRDQLDCLIAGLYAIGEYELVRQIFWAHFRRGFFAQNFERDIPGSTKHLWPHEFFKDSTPYTTTYLKSFNWKTLKFEGILKRAWNEYADRVEEKTADFADPVFGSIWHMIKAGKMWYFYWFAIIGIPLYILNVNLQADWAADPEHPVEKNQIYSQSFVNGRWALRFLNWVDPMWAVHSRNYWELRGEIEYHEIISEVVNEAVKK